ncbi:hypothetical protein EI983_11170 [Roseovarius faecimaris]|uniref:Lipoprotein n=1 Tax=Roseovarius faecimaris TaxID=2494550 RepID=A0A6I6INU7_9RHOB|nr:hypothetical protein [Roseovarius faecimaris]QGX98800.1 hypothetical protein EI983_11170 [Roseovarius faecimaris]
MTRFSLALIGIAALTACTPAEQVMMMKLENPTLDGGTYSTGGGIDIAAELREVDGMTGLCGVWAESERQAIFSKGKSGNVVRTGSAYVDGAVLHRDLGFMRKVAPNAPYTGQEASCIRTARPWSPQDQGKPVQIRIPRQVVHREDEEGDSTGLQVIFRQTGPGAKNPTLKSLIFGG